MKQVLRRNTDLELLTLFIGRTASVVLVFCRQAFEGSSRHGGNMGHFYLLSLLSSVLKTLRNIAEPNQSISNVT
jgi:hypothetical protein